MPERFLSASRLSVRAAISLAITLTANRGKRYRPAMSDLDAEPTLPDPRVGPRARCWRISARCLWTVGLAFVWSASWSGCAQWTADPENSEHRHLPPASVASEATVLDVIFWPLPDRLPAAEFNQKRGDASDETMDPLVMLWQAADELAVDHPTRQTLLSNGLRAGKIDHIEQFIERIGKPLPADAAEKLLQDASISSEIAHTQHRIPFRSGQQQEFAVRQTANENRSVIIRQGENTIGRTLVQPQFLLSVQARPETDGRVLVRAWPRIEHGPFRQSFVSNEQAIRMNSRRDRWILHELAVATRLDQNQTLLIAPQVDPFGIGKQMLTAQRPDGTTERVVILIRVARKPAPDL